MEAEAMNATTIKTKTNLKTFILVPPFFSVLFL